MPLPGGHSDKLGNQFEGWWTASVMLRLLREEDGLICLEPLGPDGEKIEFWVERNGTREVHQVKRQNHFKANWTIRQLKARGIIGAFQTHLSKGTTHAHFVSTHSVEGLAELTERARQASDEVAFRTRYLEAGAAISANTNFGRNWGGTDAEQFEALRRIHVHSVSDPFLRSAVAAQVEPWFTESPQAVVGALIDIATDRISQTLRPFDIWEELTKRKIHRRPSTDLARLAQSLRAQTDRYLNGGQGIGGERLVRQEVSALAALLQGGQRVVWVTGAAGSGKSEVVRDLVRELRGDWPTLALRLDHLTSVATAPQLANQLGLPLELPHAVATVAQGGDALLVIDQLDAVSIVSGRRGGLLDAVRETVAAGQHHTNLRIVVVCRQFDLDNDHQLRQLKDRTNDVRVVKLGDLTPQSVTATLERLGRDADTLTPQQLKLLSLPLHLAIYADVLACGEAFSDFETPTQLFEEYCRRKRRAANDRVGTDHWAEVTDALVQRMSRDELLTAPWRSVWRWKPYALELASEHVLVPDGTRVGFFHESLFDYLFGLSFSLDQPLLDWLRGEEQGLFRRAQVRQILAFRRDDDRVRYLSDLREVLLDDGVRFHLKHLVLSLLGRGPSPDAGEAEVMSEFIRGSELAEFRHALQATAAKEEWFFALRDAVSELFDHDDQAARSVALWWLSRVVDRCPDHVADLVAPLAERGGEWSDLLAWFVTLCRGYSAGDRFVDLVVELVASGALDGRDIWMWLADTGPDQSPNWSNVQRVAVALLRRNLVQSKERGEAVPLRDYWAHKVMDGLAGAAPGGFVESMLPVFVDALQGEQEGGNEDSFPIDPYPRASYLPAKTDVWASLSSSLTSAMAQLLETGDPRGTAVLREVSALESLTPQVVAARALTDAGAAAADKSVRWLLDDRRRLDLHPRGESSSTLDLIATAAATCSDEAFADLESASRAYHAANEFNAKHRLAFGKNQWRLMSALPADRLSEAGRRRMGELTRKFGTEAPRSSYSIRMHQVTSPIEPDAAARMTDEDWLRAIERYQAEWERNWDASGRPRGGARQLASLLQERTAMEPARFAALALLFPADTPRTYVEAVLAGVKGGGLDLDQLEPLIQLAHGIEERPHGGGIAALLRANPTLPWSDSALEVLTWYAANDPDPGPDRADFEGLDLSQRVYSVGMNSVRGRVAKCVGVLVHADAKRIPKLQDAIDAVVADGHDAVRSCAAVVGQGLIRHSADLAVNLAEQLLQAGGATLATSPLERLLWYLLPAHTERLLPYLERMLESPLDEVVAVASRQICLAALSDERASDLATRCINGSDAQREAAATILAANLHKTGHRGLCVSALKALFHDDSEAVRKAAASCFRQDKEADVSEYSDLVLTFIRSPAFEDDTNGLVHAFEGTSGDCSALIVATAHRFLDIAGDDAGNIQTSAAMTSGLLRPLIVRAYAQSAAGSEIRKRCLDAIDRMFLHSVDDLDSAIELAGR